MVDTPLQHIRLAAQPPQAQADLGVQIPKGRTGEVAQLDALEVLPAALDGVQIRRVGGQGLQVQAGGGAVGQKILDRLAAVDRGAVPEHQQEAWDQAQQLAQKGHHRRPVAGRGLEVADQPTAGGQRADQRDVVARPGHVQDWGLATRRPGPHPRRQEVAAGLVYPDDRATVRFGFFLSAGQRSCHQRSIAAASRWVAWVTGCWTLQSNWRSRRLRWAG